MTMTIQSIRAFMSSPVATVPLDASVSACAALMARADHRHLPVVDAQGRFAGLVTDRALMALELFFTPQDPVPDAETLFWDGAQAQDLAVMPPTLFSPDAPAALVLRAMEHARQDAAVLIDADGCPVGIFTDHDVSRLAVEYLEPDLTTEDMVRQSLVAVDPAQSVRLARVLMNASNVRHVLVVGEAGVEGVLSWRDLARRGFLQGYEDMVQDLDTATGSLIGREPVTVPIGTSLRDIAGLLVEERVGCIPVLDAAGAPVSVISRTDLVTLLASRLDARAA